MIDAYRSAVCLDCKESCKCGQVHDGYICWDCARARLAAAEALLRDLATNWDCDHDGHKYGTGCRACHAKDYFNQSGEECDA